MIKRYWNGIKDLLRFIWHSFLDPKPFIDILINPVNYVQNILQILLVLGAFLLAYTYDIHKQNKDERERDAAIITAYKMELSNNVVMIQMNLNIIRQPIYSTNARTIGPLFTYRNTGLDLIRQRIPNQFLKKPITLHTISSLYTLIDHANDQLRLRIAGRLASASLPGGESELLLFDKQIVVEHNNLLDKTTNALIDLDKL